MGKRVGRPPSCTCGTCEKCKRAAYMRRWWASQSPAERRARTARRDRERVRANDRERGGARGTPRPRKHRAATQRVYMAVKRGELAREPCLFCDDPATVAHHHDYGLPLVVTWLCRRHHGRVHASERQRVG